MNFAKAQQDMRRAYVDGGPGVLVSALNWFVAFAVQQHSGTKSAFIALFVGGMFIFPIGKSVTRFVFGRADETPGNPLSATALESTLPMLAGLFGAWLILPLAPSLALPLSALAVGTRYALFRTVYGDLTFLFLGGLICAIGLLEILMSPLPGGTLLLVALAELIFGIGLTVRGVRASHHDGFVSS